mgnify:FL=1
MNRVDTAPCDIRSSARMSSRRRSKATSVIALTCVSVVSVAGLQISGQSAAGAASQTPTKTGFVEPFAGVHRYEKLAPTQITHSWQLNQALGQRRADEIAKKIGLKRSDVFTKKQYRLFVTGRGVGGDKSNAKLVDQSVRILTNTAGRPLYSKIHGKLVPSVLASYGLMVNKSGMLESPANSSAPTRKVNAVIEPGGYLGQWCRANGAKKALRMLYRSAYTAEAVYGNKAQQISGAAQLVANKKVGKSTKTVGMSMVPSIWIVNFALIYTLNPAAAAEMPAKWAPIPRRVAKAIEASSTGQVPYLRYASSLR